MKGLQGTEAGGMGSLGDESHVLSVSEDWVETHGWGWHGPSMLLQALAATWFVPYPM